MCLLNLFHHNKTPLFLPCLNQGPSYYKGLLTVFMKQFFMPTSSSHGSPHAIYRDDACNYEKVMEVTGLLALHHHRQRSPQSHRIYLEAPLVNKTGATVDKYLQLPADIKDVIGCSQDYPIRCQHLLFNRFKPILLWTATPFVALIAA